MSRINNKNHNKLFKERAMAIARIAAALYELFNRIR